MHNTDLIKILKAMDTANILVIGDIMLDRFVYGAAERISPESPVPVLRVSREDSMLGGAGNTVANLVGLRVNAHIVSVIGDDEDGKALQGLVADINVPDKWLIVDGSRPTITKTRFLAGHQQLLRADYEHKAALSAAVKKQVLDYASDLMPRMDALVLSDYGKGLLDKDVIAALMKVAKKHGMPVVVDPKGQDFTVYRGASVITPNKKELSEATAGLPVDTDEQAVEAAGKIMKECKIDAVVATRSKDGLSVIEKKKAPVHIASEDIEVFDVSGAGDAVIATIASGLAAGGSLEDAGRLANIAGSIVVTKVGTAAIRADEIEAKLNDYAADKIAVLDSSAAAEQVKRWKARGLVVGFTNGCFDILHMGHTSYLNDARGACDRLIVGLNSDSSVRILKGEGRPVHDETSRATVLGALGAVDMVVLFGAEKPSEDNTAIGLIEALKPDVYFKGGDYTEEQIPEASSVKAGGGVVKVMPVYEGYSTTIAVEKIKEQAA